MKVLIAEDEPDMRKIIGLYVKQQGLDIVLVGNGEDAVHVLEKEKIDLAVLDWMMPKLDGIEVCRYIRRLKYPVKIIMLTAKGAPEDEITGLRDGADDYIKKPFDPRVLALRIGKLLNTNAVLSCRGIILDRKTGKACKNGTELTLSKKEYELLEYFLLNTGIILTREKLLDSIWGTDYVGDERTVDTHIRRLRSRIGEECILTHRGIGYSFEEES